MSKVNALPSPTFKSKPPLYDPAISPSEAVAYELK